MMIEKLQAELDRVNAERIALNSKARDLAAALTEAKASEAAKARLANMSPVELAMLKIELNASGRG